MHFDRNNLKKYGVAIGEYAISCYYKAERWILQHLPREMNQNINDKTFSSEGIERLAALALDLFIAAILTLFPLGGKFLAVIYILVKDALPFLQGQSVGKRFFGLRVVRQQSMRPITRNYKKSAIRGGVMLVPGLNLYDIYHYLVHGQRKADHWAGTVVIKDRYFVSSERGNEM